jgi:hypothetical protein
MNKAIIFFFCSFLFQTISIAQETAKWNVEVAASYRVNKSENLKGLGALVSRKLTGDFWLKSGIIYKNQKENFETQITSDHYQLTYDVELRLDYITIPLMLMYNGGFLNLGLGTNYERFLSSKDLSDNPFLKSSLSPVDKNKWYLTGYIGYPVSVTNNIQIEPGVLFNYANERIFSDLNLSFKYIF